MATLKSNNLFFTTSPRTPSKMLPEIKLLIENFSGKNWNHETQENFMSLLAEQNFFEGVGTYKDMAFSARDRINRAPKALGFVNLNPTIYLTDAGKEFIFGKRPQEIFLHQLLKFQLPSPYHKANKNLDKTFCIKPYLEILRLMRELEYLTFDELKIFVMNFIDYKMFDEVKNIILHFREDGKDFQGNYKKFVETVWTTEILKSFESRIVRGKTKTRETQDDSLKKFVATKKNNFRDYADACFRYLRYTELISISQLNFSINIPQNKISEVDYILENVSREPIYIDNEVAYKNYLFDAAIPKLYTDNRNVLINFLEPSQKNLSSKSVEELKNLYSDTLRQNKILAMSKQIDKLKTQDLYFEVAELFNRIIKNECYDAPLMLEFNTWRAMTILDGGEIKGNFHIDDNGEPLSTAAGNMADIECFYKNFVLSVEVTLQAGQRQFETEGESVARHFGKLRKRFSDKETYCLFIAKKVHSATLAYFYGLNHINIEHYGGKSKIIPLDLSQFMILVANAHCRKISPSSADLKKFFDEVVRCCEISKNEIDWKEKIQESVNNWLK